MIATVFAFFVRFLAGATTRYREELQGSVPRVFYANHSSHLDFVLIWASLPPAARRHVHPVAARDYWTQGMLRRFIAGRLFGGLMIERHRSAGAADPVGQMIDVLDAGDALILFPEGTRGSGEAVAPFKSGLFRIAEDRSSVELVPVHLENLNLMLPKGAFLPVPLLSFITFGAPLPRIRGESRDAFLERARQALIALEAD